jgi:hypothetical protein
MLPSRLLLPAAAGFVWWPGGLYRNDILHAHPVLAPQLITATSASTYFPGLSHPVILLKIEYRYRFTTVTDFAPGRGTAAHERKNTEHKDFHVQNILTFRYSVVRYYHAAPCIE